MNDEQPERYPTILLLVLPLPMFRLEGRLFIDRQALNGLHRWLGNFDRLILALPIIDVAEAPAGLTPFDEEAFDGRCRFVPLPNTRRPVAFFCQLRPTTRKLDDLIDQSTHLSFAIGGLFGDWAAIALLRAAKKHRIASVWTDRVESEVTRVTAARSTGIRRIYGMATAFMMQKLERYVIRRAAIGLFHGADCFAAYARFSPDPHLVHDIHLTDAARIAPATLAQKITRAASGEPLSIVYAGRAHPDKGVLDWVETLIALKTRGVTFVATWFGDGPVLTDARQTARAAGLSDRVSFPGGIEDHEDLMRRLRSADLFVFCHKTPESPRCLIEALLSGTPIVGYDSAYPRDLIAKHEGGVLTRHSPAMLADAIASLAGDRDRLGRMMTAAAADGHPHTDRDVFQHRSDLIKQI